MMLRTVKQVGVFVAGVVGGLIACSSTPETVMLENGATGYRIPYCADVGACELRAQQLCVGKPYFVHERWKYGGVAVESNERGVREVGGDWDGVRGGSELRRDSQSMRRPWYALVIECDPATPGADPDYAKALAEHLALDAKRRRDYIAAVCKLRDPDTRREEMEIARQRYGDFPCP